MTKGQRTAEHLAGGAAMTAYSEHPPALDAYLAAIEDEATHFECGICSALEDIDDGTVLQVTGDLNFDGSVCESCHQQVSAAFGQHEESYNAVSVLAPAPHNTEGNAA